MFSLVSYESHVTHYHCKPLWTRLRSNPSCRIIDVQNISLPASSHTAVCVSSHVVLAILMLSPWKACMPIYMILLPYSTKTTESTSTKERLKSLYLYFLHTEKQFDNNVWKNCCLMRLKNQNILIIQMKIYLETTECFTVLIRD